MKIVAERRLFHAEARESPACAQDVLQFPLLYNRVSAPRSPPGNSLEGTGGTGAGTVEWSMPESVSNRDEATLTRWADVPVEALNPLLTRQFITGSQAMLARIDLKQGARVPRHSHPNEQISWITEGALRFTLGAPGDERTLDVRAGEVLVIPGNLPHAAEALEDTVDFDLFAPPRQDWIAKEDAYLR